MSKRKGRFAYESARSKKHTLDSDEEEKADNNVLDDNDIEGEEEGIATNRNEETFTAFNMREEMEEGHFDKDGHFIWKNEKEVRDNWLDNIDWQKIQTKENAIQEQAFEEDSDDSNVEQFQEIEAYKQILPYMKPTETLNKTISRLGKNKKLSSLERLRRKKAGLLESDHEVIHLTELANKFLSAGNMDIYQETFESITRKIENDDKKMQLKNTEPELDMYADDFDVKANHQLNDGATTSSHEPNNMTINELMWEFKWKLEESDKEIQGPYNSEQMLKFANEGYFKTGVWARKKDSNADFHSTNRIDFDLYI